MFSSSQLQTRLAMLPKAHPSFLRSIGYFVRKTHTASRVEHSRIALEKCGFSSKQTDIIVGNLGPYLQYNSPEIIKSSFECWKKNLPTKNDDLNKSDQRFRDVFLTKEPRLLLLNSDCILQRMESLKSLDIVRGSSDLWRLFLKAPTGCYLQNWNEFLKKYYYVTYKVLPWIEPKIAHDSLNPILKCPGVFDLTFNVLKTRYLFAQRVGYREVNTTMKNSQLNLHTLFLLPVDEFLKMLAPNCTIEEFHALEKLNSHSTGEEDDKLFEDLVDLAPKVNSKDFINSNLQEKYLISKV